MKRTTTTNDPTTALPGRPPVVDLATWQAARDELLVREKAHTREGDAIAAARRRLPMVESDGTVEVVGPDGPVPFLELFQGRRAVATSRSTGPSACSSCLAFLLGRWMPGCRRPWWLGSSGPCATARRGY
jgi:predicted dithiol-disulfide oxidoreductase (DUF899 family)